MTTFQRPPTTRRRLPDLEAHIQELTDESLAHPAVHHPYLRAFAAGDFADPVEAMRHYALEYSGYAAWFPHYLRTVIRRLERANHRKLLLRNLEEERGELDPEDCDALRAVGIAPEPLIGIPHPQLFRRFCHALGLTDEQLKVPSAAAVKWRSDFLEFLGTATAAEAVGALGLGTEHIVRPVYEHLLTGIRRTGVLQRSDYVFFELHCLVDDQHQQDLLAIARELASDEHGLEELRRGMRVALDLRCEFWNAIAATAQPARRARIA